MILLPIERCREQAKSSLCGCRRTLDQQHFLDCRRSVGKLLLLDPLSLNFLWLTFNNHILRDSDVLWQVSDEATDGCVIVEEWKNPEGFCGSSYRPQQSNGHSAHNSRIVEGCNCVEKIHIELPYPMRCSGTNMVCHETSGSRSL